MSEIRTDSDRIKELEREMEILIERMDNLARRFNRDDG